MHNRDCPGALTRTEDIRETMGYGRLYLERRTCCESCGAPVLELSSCRKCGEAYSIAVSKNNLLMEVPRNIEEIEENESILYLTPNERRLLSCDEETGEEDITETDSNSSNSANHLNGGFKLKPSHIFKESTHWQIRELEDDAPNADRLLSDDSYKLFRYIKDKAKSPALESEASPPCCPACGAKTWRSRFTSFTDSPLSVVIDRLFDLLSEPVNASDHGILRETEKIQKPNSKILTFSDGRQDAAYFASDFQRSHTEFLYRQCIWTAFQKTSIDDYSTITDMEQELQHLFRVSSIPHPDREPERHHKSYSSNESNKHLNLGLTSRDLDNLAKNGLVKYYCVNSVYLRPGGDQWRPLVCWPAM